MARLYDVIIIGGGAAGFTAGLYTARSNLSTLLLEKSVWGGQIAVTGLVENYPGFPDGVMGLDLSQAMYDQAVKFGLDTQMTEATELRPEGRLWVVETLEGELTGKSVIVASGGEHRKLGVPGEKEYAARGVSYCAVCDGAFFRGLEVAVVGGGDAAIDEGLYLTRLTSRVRVIHRRDQLRASPILQERAFATANMEFLWNTVVEEIMGDGEEVTGLRLRNVQSEERSQIQVAGVFIYIGFDSASRYLQGLLKLDPLGHVPVNDLMETELPGLFAAGDVRVNSTRQLVSAAGDGCVAALSAYKYITEHWKEG